MKSINATVKSNLHKTILLFTTIIAVVYFSLGINSWKFSYVGDDWAFYEFAKEIAEKNLLVNPFDTKGVYFENPVLGSFYQAIFLKIFGINNFAWRFSNIFLIIPISIFLYLWLKNWFNRNVALFSTLLLQSSFFLANYFKIGYPNPQALFFLITSLYLASSCALKPSTTKFLILGIVLGLSFYVYIGPLIPFIIWPFLLPYFLDKNYLLKDKLISLLFIAFGYALFIIPALLDPVHWSAASKKTLLGAKEFEDNKQILINIYRNGLLFYKNYDYLYNHFIIGPYLDIITRLLAALGTVLTFIFIKKREYLIFLLSYLSAIIILGLTSPYPYTATTRGIFIIPFGFIFAAVALHQVSNKRSPLFIAPVFVIIFFINLYYSQIGVFKDPDTSITSQALIIREIQQLEDNNSVKAITIYTSENYDYNYQILMTMLQAYNLNEFSINIVKTNLPNCALFNNNPVLIFEKDTAAMETFSAINCANGDESSVKVIPATTLF